MKVLHVIPSLSKLKGGPTPITLNMVQALQKEGVDARILTTDDDGTKRLDVELNKWITYEGVPTYFLPRFEFPLKEYIYCPGMKAWLNTNLQEYDIVHTHYLFSYAPFIAAKVARKIGIPYIITPYGMLAPWAIAHQKHKKLFFRIRERKSIKLASGIHCSTETEVENIQNFGVSHNLFINPYIVSSYALIDNAKVDLHREYSIPSNEVVILYLARLHAMKQPDLLIKAVQTLREEGLPVHLLMAGNGDPKYVNYLKKTASSLIDLKGFTFAGFVSGHSKEVLYQGADIYALPSHSENFGMTVCEASLSQTPVLITPGVQIHKEVAHSKSGLIAENNLKSVTDQLRLLATNPDLRKQMGVNGRQWVVSSYNSEKVAQDLIKEYQKILTRK